MKKQNYKLLFVAFALLGSMQTFSQEWSSIPVPASAGSGMTWELQENVSDDFSYSKSFSSGEYASRSNFGSSNQWNNFYHNAWDGPGYTYWDNSNVSVDGDNLVITAGYTSESSKGGSYGVASGCVTSNNTVNYPVFVESAISVANISLASCFWLLSPDDTEEIDIIENYGGVNGYKHLTHISHHSFVRSPFTDYQPRDWNSWYPDLQGRLTTSYGWGDWCWNNGGERRYMRMGVNWIGPKHFEYYIDGELVRVMYYNAIATNMNGTWQYTYFNSKNWNVNGYMLPTNDGSGYTDVTTYSTSSSYNFATLQAASNASNGYSVVDPAWFQGADTQDADGNGVTNEAKGFTKDLEIIINIESQSWLTGSTPSYNDLNDASKNQMKVDWVRVYKPVPGDDDDSDDVAVTGVSITPATLSLNVGETGNVTGAVSPSDATDQTMTFISGNEAIATVTQSGVVTAVSAGTAVITATTTDGGYTATSTVTVSEIDDEDDDITADFVIEAEDFTGTGGTYNDGYVSYGVNASSNSVNYVNSGDWATYTVSNAASGVYSIAYSASTPMDNAEISLYVDDVLVSTEAVTNNGAWDSYYTINASESVELDGNHTVKFVASGSNAWQFNLNSISFTRTGDIEDTDIAVTGVSITPATLSLNVGETGNVTGAVSPSDATDQTMTFISDDVSVATVTQSGVVTAVSAGTAVITATTTDGGYTATSTVTVSDIDDEDQVTSIVIEAEDFANTGGTYNDGYVSYGVNSNGVALNYINTGDWATYTVSNAASGVYRIAYSISTPLDNAEISIYVDDVLVSTDAVTNNGAWDSFYNLNAGSSAELNGNHTVKFVASGSNAWQFNLNSISFTRTGDIEDTDIAVTGVSITPASLSLNVGETGNVTGAVSPSDATDQTMTFISDNVSVATVTQSGVVTAVSAGTAVITATTTDGGYTATSTVTVSRIDDIEVFLTIEAEDFEETGGTYNDGFVPNGVNEVSGVGINWVNNGDWTTYSVTIPEDGNYEIVYHISSPITGSTIQLYADDALLNTTTVPNNGGWDDYTTLTASENVNFTAGTHEIKLQAGSTSWTWNLDKVTLEWVGEMKRGVISGSVTDEVSIYPVPATDYISISGLDDSSYEVSIINMMGVMCASDIISGSSDAVNISDLPTGNYIVTVKGEVVNKVFRLVKSE